MARGCSPLTMEECGDSFLIFPSPDTFNTVNNPLLKSTHARAGALVTFTILPGWRATRVGPGQYPQYTRASRNGWSLRVARKHHNLTSPIRTNHTRNYHTSGQEILYLRALQGHSGRNFIDPSLQDNVLIPNDFFEYIYHIGCAIILHSITNSGLLPGVQNLSKRQTVFFTSVEPMHKEHRDPTSGDRCKVGLQPSCLEPCSRVDHFIHGGRAYSTRSDSQKRTVACTGKSFFIC